MNFLFCSAGRRCELLKDLKATFGKSVNVVATDASKLAPALYFADEHYIVPNIDDPGYIAALLEICEKENINVMTTCIDPEISVLASNRALFEDRGVTVLCPSFETAQACLDKYQFAQRLRAAGLPAVPTFGDLDEFYRAQSEGLCDFPVFVKPRSGSGSVGARRVDDAVALQVAMEKDASLIIQPYYADAEDLDADVYVDVISHEVASVFLKRKLSSTIGGANKTVSIKDATMVDLIKRLACEFQFHGPIDVDFFKVGDRYFISEVNPRFGGAYLHAYGAGVNFFNLICRNIDGKPNTPMLQDYEEGIYMLMFDCAFITRLPM